MNYQPINCEDRGVDKVFKNKIIIYSQEDVAEDDFREPTKMYIINAWNDRVYIKAKKRKAAQEVSDEIYGKGKYVVREVIRAIVC